MRAKIEVSCTVHSSASAARMARSTAWRLSTGSAPGKPRHTGQTWVFGGAPKAVEHPQKILVAVLSCAWISRPMTGTYGIGAYVTGQMKTAGRLDGVRPGL